MSKRIGHLAIGPIVTNGDKNGTNGDPLSLMANASNGANGAPHQSSSFCANAIAIGTIGDHWRHLNGTDGAIKWRCHGQDRHQKEVVPLATMVSIMTMAI